MTVEKPFSYIINDDQNEVVGKATSMLREAFPKLAPRELITKILAPSLLGPPPEWSQPNGYQLGRGAIFNSGTFCIYWGRDPERNGEIVALVHTRKEQTDDWRFKLGAIGGYTNAPEQSHDAVLREALEELCDSGRVPIFTPDSFKYVLLREGKDFESKDPPVDYTAFAYELTPDEITRLKSHIKRCNDPNDTGYIKGVMKASGGETLGLDMKPLNEIIAMHPSDFTHYQQYYNYKEVANRLGIGVENPTKPSSPIGYTLGDIMANHQSHMRYDTNTKTMSRYGVL